MEPDRLPEFAGLTEEELDALLPPPLSEEELDALMAGHDPAELATLLEIQPIDLESLFEPLTVWKPGETDG
jgi:hypothetical protein